MTQVMVKETLAMPFFKGEEKRTINSRKGTFLVIQWQRLRAPNAGDLGSILGWETKIPHGTTKSSHAPTKTEDPVCCNKDLAQSNK